MAVYVYDGTFEGFLTAVSMAMERNEAPEDISRVLPSQSTLFHRILDVETGQVSSAELFNSVAPAISARARRDAFHAFLSGDGGIEMAVYRYIKFGGKMGKSLDRLLCHDLVLPVRKMALKVRSEAHRMKGFVRFRQVREGFYYARLEPDNNILPLIAPHFADRFSDQDWIIHDLRRGQGLIFHSAVKEWIITGLGLCEEPVFSESESFFNELWKRYFVRISVEERENPGLQRQMLPKKYRKHLVELEGRREELSTELGYFRRAAHLLP